MNAAVRAVVNCAQSRGVEVLRSYARLLGTSRGRHEDTLRARRCKHRRTRRHRSLFRPLYCASRPPRAWLTLSKKLRKEPDRRYRCDRRRRRSAAQRIFLITESTIRNPRHAIDSDATSTDYSIGFDTAMNTVLEMADRLRDTCEITRTLQRDRGNGTQRRRRALLTGIASGCAGNRHPEGIRRGAAAIEKKIKTMKANGRKRSFIVIVAEGVGGFLRELYQSASRNKPASERSSRV